MSVPDTSPGRHSSAGTKAPVSASCDPALSPSFMRTPADQESTGHTTNLFERYLIAGVIMSIPFKYNRIRALIKVSWESLWVWEIASWKIKIRAASPFGNRACSRGMSLLPLNYNNLPFGYNRSAFAFNCCDVCTRRQFILQRKCVVSFPQTGPPYLRTI